MPGVDAREQGSGGARHGDAHPWLENPVPGRHTTELAIEMGTVERMQGDSDELSGHVARQAGVGVEGDDIADLLKNRAVAHHALERRGRRTAQQGVELLDLSALSLPAHPHALSWVPLSWPVEEVESIFTAVPVTGIERFDPGNRGGENLLVFRALRLHRVREIREEREVEVGIRVPQRLHFEMLDLRPGARDAPEKRGHDHHGARPLRHAVLELDPGQAPRPRDAMHRLLYDQHRELARWDEQEQADPRQERIGSASASR